MGKSCFFIGHRDTAQAVNPLLLDSIGKHITEHGVTDFYVGHYGAFDAMVANNLHEMKKHHPLIRNYLLLAYHPAIRKVDVPKGFESTVLIDGQELSPPLYAITNLNRRMVRTVDYLIAYVRGITGGSYKLLQIAKARERGGQLVITNLADWEMGEYSK